MGRKKRKGAQLKPFCFYCDREFDDEKVLIQHQKAKHFKCSECNRKLDTATGLIVHMLQVHKETISRVPNGNPGRDNPDYIIHGMAGVPVELLNEKQAKLDEERGAAKHKKSAHTVFGMSVMSGFLNQMNAAGGGPGAANFPSFMGMPNGIPNFGFTGLPGGNTAPNQFNLNQFMAQMSQNPQTALHAITNGVRPPQMQQSLMGAQQSTPDGPSSTVPSGSSGSISSFIGSTGFRPTTLGEDSNTGPHSTRLPSNWSTPLSTNPTPVLPGGLPGKLGFGLPSALGLAKSSQLTFDPTDDTISPEELLAKSYEELQPAIAASA